MRAAVRAWWIGLARRERAAVLAAAALALGATLYLAALEPAWRTRARLAAELPRLRAEAAEVDALALEAKKLRGRAAAPGSAAQTRAALAKLLAEKRIAASAIREGDDQRLHLSVQRAEAAAWLDWLKQASTELPLRITWTRISRAGPGLVDAEVALTPAGAR